MSLTAHRLDLLMQASALPRHEARRLMSLVTGKPMTWVIAHGDDEADPDTARRFKALAARRRAGEPLAYLTGEQEFYGRPFLVSPAVLIPRADTETLIDVALARLAATGEATAPPDTSSDTDPGPAPPGAASTPAPASAPASGPLSILDLGTGSGIIAITLALAQASAGAGTAADVRPPHHAARPRWTIHAVDRSADALSIARQNASRLGAAVTWHQGSWWDALPADTPPFDLVVSNPPYIAAGDHHLQQGDLRFEPPGALAAGPDGLDDLRLIIAGASQRLKPGGWLLLEHGYDQAAPVQALLRAAGFAGVFTRRDLAGQPRVSGGQWPPASGPGSPAPSPI